MGAYRLYSWLTRRSRAELQDRSLRRLHAAGPRASFRGIVDRLRGPVLDVGCGTGILLQDYPVGLDVIASDPDLDFLKLSVAKARKAGARVRVVPADAEHLPFADQTFSAVVVNLVLCSVSDPAAALREICRVLRSGGLLYLYEHVISRNRFYRAFQNATAPVVCWFCEGCHWNRDLAVYLRDLPVAIEKQEHSRLQSGVLPPLPITCVTAYRR